MSLFISTPRFSNILARVLLLTDDEAVRLISAESREKIEDILAKHQVPAETEAVRFVYNGEKFAVVIAQNDVGCQLAPEVHPTAFEF